MTLVEKMMMIETKKVKVSMKALLFARVPLLVVLV